MRDIFKKIRSKNDNNFDKKNVLLFGYETLINTHQSIHLFRNTQCGKF